MTKKPATPLPWRSSRHPNSNFIKIVGGIAQSAAEMNGPDSVENAAYIVHACNAYPKLVEGLREDLGAFAILTASHPAKNGLVNKRIDAIHSVLKDLGEE